MKPLVLASGLLFASLSYAAGEPDWCDVEKNYPMERRGLGCIEACTEWREAEGIVVVEPSCPPAQYAYSTFRDVEHQGEEVVCVVKIRCVSVGSP